MDTTRIESSGTNLLHRIEPLWQELKTHHIAVSTHFSNEFEAYSFEARKAALYKGLKSDSLLVEIAVDSKSMEDVGYCVCSIHPDRQGEIESIYVKPSFRRSGVGQRLLSRGIEWLNDRKVMEIVVDVAFGNDQVFGLYEQFGFYPRKTVLKQKRIG